jgi:hypothetical protein
VSTIEERNEAASKANDGAETQTLFQPSRSYRRSASGQPCAACGVGMHHADIWAVRADTDLVLLHGQCALAIAERAGTEETDES